MIVSKSKNVISHFQANDFNVSNTLCIHKDVKIKKSKVVFFKYPSIQSADFTAKYQ